MKINRFSDLTVWQKAHELTLATYRLTEKFPRSEQYGIVSQLRRSSASVPANIAEGFGRRTTKVYCDVCRYQGENWKKRGIF